MSCDDFCFPVNNDEGRCECQDRYQLANDGTSCEEDPQCVGNFTKNGGFITSPFYPKNYDDDMTCEYVITAPVGYRVSLLFSHMDLGSQECCEYDKIIVYDINNDTLLVASGTQLPDKVRSFFNHLKLVFISDSSEQFTGFRLKYIFEKDDGFLIFTTSLPNAFDGAIMHRLDVETSSSVVFDVDLNQIRPTAVVYDPLEYPGGQLYWSGTGVLSFIYRTLVDGSTSSVFLDVGNTADILGLALDIQSRLLFYTDADAKVIEMVSLRNGSRRTVIQNLTLPCALQLDIHNGQIYWADCGEEKKIEKINYNGSNHITLLSGIQLVASFALDLTNDRIYWVNGADNVVSSSTLTGEDRQVRQLVVTASQFYALAFKDGELFVVARETLPDSSQPTSCIFKHNVSANESDIKQPDCLWKGIDIITSIHATQSHSQAEKRNGCSAAGDAQQCAEMCVPLPDLQYQCVCPDYQRLDASGTNCVDDGTKLDRHPLVSHEICHASSIGIEGYVQSPNFPFSYANNLQCDFLITVPDGYRVKLTFERVLLHSKQNSIGGFFGDSVKVYDGDLRHKVLMKVMYGSYNASFSLRSFHKTMVINFQTDSDGTSHGFNAKFHADADDTFMLLLRKDLFDRIYLFDPVYCSGHGILLLNHGGILVTVSYDSKQKRVYWVEKSIVNKYHVLSSNFDGLDVRRHRLAARVYRIVDIAVDALTRVLFYVDDIRLLIGMLTLTNDHDFIVLNTFQRPSAVTVDPQIGKLYWSEINPGIIKSANYDGTQVMILFTSDVEHVNFLTMDFENSYLYWIGNEPSTVYKGLTNGSHLETVFHDTSFSVDYTGIALHHDTLFVSFVDQMGEYYVNGHLMKMSISSLDGGSPVSLLSGQHIIKDIQMYYENAGNTGENGCSHNNGGCIAICIPLPSNRSKCACPVNFVMLPNGKDCVFRYCGQTFFTEESGSFKSPRYSTNYPIKIICHYYITVEEGQNILLRISEVSLLRGGSYADSHGCDDYFKVFDGHKVYSQSLMQTCRIHDDIMIRSFSNKLRIEYISNVTANSKRFAAHYVSAPSFKLPFLLVTRETFPTNRNDQEFAHLFDLRTRSNTTVSILNGSVTPVFTAYDSQQDLLYLSTYNAYSDGRLNLTQGLYQCHLMGRSSCDSSGVYGVVKAMVVDDVNRMLFYVASVDVGQDSLNVMRLIDPFPRRTIVANVSLISAIAVHPHHGWLFWSTSEKLSVIMRSRYDGEQQSAIFTQPGKWGVVKWLTIHVESNMLYFIINNTVMAMSLNGLPFGEHLTHILDMTHIVLFDVPAVAIYGDYIFIILCVKSVDNPNSAILRMQVGHSSQSYEMWARFSGILRSLQVVPSTILASAGQATCLSDDGGCKDFCFPVDNEPTRCMCSDDMWLAGDNSSCFPLSKSVNVTITPSVTMPIAMVGEQEMLLTCEADASLVSECTWSVMWKPAYNDSNVCSYLLHVDDDGREIGCSVWTMEGATGYANITVFLNYPPSSPPTISDNNGGKPILLGSYLSLTCSVEGGKPLVDSVDFSCLPHTADNRTDMRNNSLGSVSSSVSFGHVTASHNGTVCVCSAVWQETRWYTLTVFYNITVIDEHVRQKIEPQSSDKTSNQLSVVIIILLVAVGVVIVVVAAAVVAVVIVRKRKVRHNSCVLYVPKCTNTAFSATENASEGEVIFQDFTERHLLSIVESPGVAS